MITRHALLQSANPLAARVRRSAMIVAAAVSTLAASDTPIPTMSARGPEVRLSGDVVSLPIVMVKEFPFVESEIEGVLGKLMLDTGAPEALVVNDHRVPLQGGRSIGTGRFGSGQTYSVRLVPEVHGVRIGRLAFPKVTDVSTQDARVLEDNVTPDFIGWLGYQAYGDRAMKLDYRRSKATFYKGGPSAYLAGERVIAELPFEVRKRPNDPIMTIRVGEVIAEAVFDTGQYGQLYVDEVTKARLINGGWLKPSAKEERTFDLTGLHIAEHPVASIKNLTVSTDPYMPGKSVGMTGPANMTIGYGFLQHYKTVWDYRSRRLYLLAR